MTKPKEGEIRSGTFVCFGGHAWKPKDLDENCPICKSGAWYAYDYEQKRKNK